MRYLLLSFFLLSTTIFAKGDFNIDLRSKLRLTNGFIICGIDNFQNTYNWEALGSTSPRTAINSNGTYKTYRSSGSVTYISTHPVRYSIYQSNAVNLSVDKEFAKYFGITKLKKKTLLSSPLLIETISSGSTHSRMLYRIMDRKTEQAIAIQFSGKWEEYHFKFIKKFLKRIKVDNKKDYIKKELGKTIKNPEIQNALYSALIYKAYFAEGHFDVAYDNDVIIKHNCPEDEQNLRNKLLKKFELEHSSLLAMLDQKEIPKVLVLDLQYADSYSKPEDYSIIWDKVRKEFTMLIKDE